MVFKLFRKKDETNSSLLTSHSQYQGDELDRAMTDIAIQLINGEGNSKFRIHFIRLFKDEPRFIKNVAPSHREALWKVLNS